MARKVLVMGTGQSALRLALGLQQHDYNVPIDHGSDNAGHCAATCRQAILDHGDEPFDPPDFFDRFMDPDKASAYLAEFQGGSQPT